MYCFLMFLPLSLHISFSPILDIPALVDFVIGEGSFLKFAHSTDLPFDLPGLSIFFDRIICISMCTGSYEG